jgi:hypothetical protein
MVNNNKLSRTRGVIVLVLCQKYWFAAYHLSPKLFFESSNYPHKSTGNTKKLMLTYEYPGQTTTSKVQMMTHAFPPGDLSPDEKGLWQKKLGQDTNH